MSALPPEADISDGRFLSEIWVWHAFACDPSKQLHRFQRQNRFNRIDERSAAFAKFAFIAFPSGESDLQSWQITSDTVKADDKSTPGGGRLPNSCQVTRFAFQSDVIFSARCCFGARPGRPQNSSYRILWQEGHTIATLNSPAKTWTYQNIAGE